MYLSSNINTLAHRLTFPKQPPPPSSVYTGTNFCLQMYSFFLFVSMPVQISDGYYITHNGPLHLKITSIQSSLTRFFYRFQLHLTVFLRRGPSDRLYETTVWLNNVKKNTSGWAINQDFFVKVPFPVKN